jgi:hypothetical protein
VTWIERFWSNVDSTRLSPGGCWLWQRSVDRDGYGRVYLGGRSFQAHRVACELELGDLGLDVLHRCDTPACVNPAHLFAGTHLDNMRDKVAKGRQARLKGEAHGRARVTAEQVKAIRRRGTENQDALAAEFGISQASVHRIIHRKTWKEIE